MAIYGPKVRSVGTSAYPLTANGSHNFKRDYFVHAGSSGDVRGTYQDLKFTSTGSGETLRLRGIAAAASGATNGTINALHATGRVDSGGTVSGSLNAVRATLEVAGTTPTPGGKLSALRVDSNIVTGATMGTTDAFISVGDQGATELKNFLCIDAAPGAKDSGDMFLLRHADCAATHAIQIVDSAGTNYWLMVTTDTPAN